MHLLLLATRLTPLLNVDLDGKKIVILVEDNGFSRYMSREIMQYETNPDNINTAILERNNTVEELLHCKLSEVRTNAASGDAVRVIRNEMMGTSSYDLVMPYMTGASVLAADGAFLDLKNFSDVIKLQNDYWDGKAVEDLSIANRVFFATGDFSLLTFDCTHAIVFNKTVISENANLEDPYKLLEDGKWTFDALYKNSKLFTAENNGVDGMTWEDKWGFFVNVTCITSMFVGAGERLSRKDSNGYPYISVKTPKSATVIDKLIDIINDKSASLIIEQDIVNYQDKYSDVYLAATAAFAENRVLFRSLAIVDLNELQVFKDINYGLLPIPKFDEKQENYCNIDSADYASCFAIPRQAPDSNASAAVAEAIAIASTNTVRRQYYEVLLKGRQIADTEGEKALDLIFNNRVYEMGTIYTWGELPALVDSVVMSGSNTLESKLSAVQDEINAEIDLTIEAFKKMD
ncbi:MAG: hypothetical protein RRY76_00345 [Clostridia bacterium]